MGFKMLWRLKMVGFKNSRIHETPTLSGDTDRRNDKNLKRLPDLSNFFSLFLRGCVIHLIFFKGCVIYFKKMRGCWIFLRRKEDKKEIKMVGGGDI